MFEILGCSLTNKMTESDCFNFSLVCWIIKKYLSSIIVVVPRIYAQTRLKLFWVIKPEIVKILCET